jgi:hypothetical protein
MVCLTIPDKDQNISLLLEQIFVAQYMLYLAKKIYLRANILPAEEYQLSFLQPGEIDSHFSKGEPELFNSIAITLLLLGRARGWR